MSKKSNEIIPFKNTLVSNIPKNLEVDFDKLGRPYAKISDDEK